MKNIASYITGFALILSFMANAQDNNGSMQKAVEKAKSDLMEILAQSGKDFNFGVTAEQLRDANGSTAIAHREVDFQKLLNHKVDSLNMSIDPLLMKSEKAIVPFISAHNVVTTITVSSNEKGEYTAGELLNQQYTTELNTLPAEIKYGGFKEVSIINVPNLRATIYHADGNMYTAYNGRSLREAQDPMKFMETLVIEARDFQEKYGELLKKQKLVD